MLGYALVLRGRRGTVAAETWFLRPSLSELSVDLATELMDGRNLYLLVAGGAELVLHVVGADDRWDLRPLITVDVGDARPSITFDAAGTPVGYLPVPLAEEGSFERALRDDALDDVGVTVAWPELPLPVDAPLAPDRQTAVVVDGRPLRPGRNTFAPETSPRS
ncbi:MAG: hypothetical protein AAF928_03245 [Myxococcota bacterium]